MNKKQNTISCCGIIPLMLMIFTCSNCMNANAGETRSRKQALSVRVDLGSLASDAGPGMDAGLQQDSGIHSDAGASSALFSEDAISLESGSEQKRLYDLYARKIATKRIRVVRINREILKGDTYLVNLNLFQGISLSARKRVLKERGTDNYSWFGRLDDGLGTVIFTVTNGDIGGLVESGDRLMNIKTLGDGLSAIIELDKSKFGPKCMMGDEEREVIHEHVEKAGRAKSGEKEWLPVNISVQFVFTDAAKNELPNMYNEAQLAVDKMNNDAFDNSNINVMYYLSAVFNNPTYTEDTDAGCLDYLTADLNNFRNGNEGLSLAHTYRDRYDADVNVMIIDQGGDLSPPTCGGFSYQAIVEVSDLCAEPTYAGASYAFSVVDTDYIQYEATPGHEIAHLHGCLHPDSPVGSNCPSGRGFLLEEGEYKTIMVVGEEDYSHIDYFSNPDVNYQGEATGEEDVADCAQIIGATANAFSVFREPSNNLTLPAETVYNKEYRYATANNSLSTTYGQSYTIKSGATVHFQSGASGTITLKKGFKAESGAYFRAFR